MELDPQCVLPIGVVLIRAGEPDADDMLVVVYGQNGRFYAAFSDDAASYGEQELDQDDLCRFLELP